MCIIHEVKIKERERQLIMKLFTDHVDVSKLVGVERQDYLNLIRTFGIVDLKVTS